MKPSVPKPPVRRRLRCLGCERPYALDENGVCALCRDFYDRMRKEQGIP